MFNNAKSISFRGGQVKRIVRTRDNVILYQLEEELISLVLTVTESVSAFIINLTTEDENGNFVELNGNATLNFYKNNQLLRSVPGAFIRPIELQLPIDTFEAEDVLHVEIPTQNLISNSVTIQGIFKDYIELKFPYHGTEEYPYTFQDFWGPPLSIDDNSILPNIYIDWGDESQIENWTYDPNNSSRSISHTYQSIPTYDEMFPEYGYTVKIYGNIYKINQYHLGCSFRYIRLPNTVKKIEKLCASYSNPTLAQLHIPKSVETIVEDAFYSNPMLEEIYLNWTESNDIIQYNPLWQKSRADNNALEPTDIETRLWFIPYGTKSLYIQKGYPEEYLEELQRFETTIWEPALEGETGATYKYSYSESNGEGVGKGFIFQNGFENLDNWELTFEFKHDNIRYTGICFLSDISNSNYLYNGADNANYSLTSWEGSWPGGSAYTTYQSGSVGYFDVTVTKIDSTHIRLQSSTLNRDTTVELPWLESATQLSFGARHNGATSGNMYGPCRIRNIKVVNYS